MRWSDLRSATSGPLPPPRYIQAVTADDSVNLFIFGGMEDRWDEMPYGPGAFSETDHVLRPFVILIDSMRACAAVYSNELHHLNVVTMVWTKLGTETGTPPTGRGAPGFAYWGGKLFVFGGWNFEGAGSIRFVSNRS